MPRRDVFGLRSNLDHISEDASPNTLGITSTSNLGVDPVVLLPNSRMKAAAEWMRYARAIVWHGVSIVGLVAGCLRMVGLI